MLFGSICAASSPTGLSCVLCSLAAASSVHFQGLCQCQWQGEENMVLLTSTENLLHHYCPQLQYFILFWTMSG